MLLILWMLLILDAGWAQRMQFNDSRVRGYGCQRNSKTIASTSMQMQHPLARSSTKKHPQHHSLTHSIGIVLIRSQYLAHIVEKERAHALKSTAPFSSRSDLAGLESKLLTAPELWSASLGAVAVPHQLREGSTETPARRSCAPVHRPSVG